MDERNQALPTLLDAIHTLTNTRGASPAGTLSKKQKMKLNNLNKQLKEQYPNLNANDRAATILQQTKAEHERVNGNGIL